VADALAQVGERQSDTVRGLRVPDETQHAETHKQPNRQPIRGLQLSSGDRWAYVEHWSADRLLLVVSLMMSWNICSRRMSRKLGYSQAQRICHFALFAGKGNG